MDAWPLGNWKGFPRLSLVTCPAALYPATSEAERISFNQINKKTGHRIRYLKVNADTGVPSEDIIKGYQIDRDRYLEVTKDELESTRTIKIDEFMPRTTCRLNDVDPKAWLADVLARIADLPASRLHELLPWEWKLLRQAEKPADQQAA
jgi:non-homologous end joining protein Ku